MSLVAAAVYLRLVALVMAAALSLRRRDHAGFAAALLWVTILDVARGILRARYALDQFEPDGPFVGDERIAWLVHTWLYLSGIALTAGLAIWYFARKPVDRVAVAWVGACVAVSRHGVFGSALRRDLLVCQMLSLAVAVVAVAIGVSQRVRVGITHACVAVVVAVEFATLLGGSWPHDIFGAYYLNVVLYVIMYVALCAVQGVALWLGATRSR